MSACFHVPKSSLVVYFMILDRLATADRVSKWQEGINLTCRLRDFAAETRNHLFFECVFTKKVLLEVLSCCKLAGCPTGWEGACKWISRVSRGKSGKNKVRRSSFAAAIILYG